uniref:Transposase Helix-turn-helix domain-containing protein n=1 Tax=Pasteuria ramosa TaxID=225322 RepID=A2ID51_9BACL|nr:hypothetical protein [Pasteuria ramosa]
MYKSKVKYLNMEYSKIATFDEGKFMSAVGVDKIIFEKIVNRVRKIDLKTKRSAGRQNILDRENPVYLFFHNFFLLLTSRMIAQIFGISKSTVNNIIQNIQGIAKKVLSKRYPANQSSYFSSLIFGMLIFDCTEIRIEKPKKIIKNMNLVEKSTLK